MIRKYEIYRASKGWWFVRNTAYRLVHIFFTQPNIMTVSNTIFISYNCNWLLIALEVGIRILMYYKAWSLEPEITGKRCFEVVLKVFQKIYLQRNFWIKLLMLTHEFIFISSNNNTQLSSRYQVSLNEIYSLLKKCSFKRV